MSRHETGSHDSGEFSTRETNVRCLGERESQSAAVLLLSLLLKHPDCLFHSLIQRFQDAPFYNILGLFQDVDGIVKSNSVLERPKDLRRQIADVPIVRHRFVQECPCLFFFFVLWNRTVTYKPFIKLSELYSGSLLKQRSKG